MKGIRDEIDQTFDSVCHSLTTRIAQETAKIEKAKVKEKDKRSKRVLQMNRFLKLVKTFDKSKLYISVISPFWGDDENRYSEISNSILSFLVNDIKLSRDDAISIKQKLLEHWQLRFQHNSSQPDKNAQKRISKKDFTWPVAVLLTEDGIPEIEECLSFVPTYAIKEEVSRLLMAPAMVYHERFEFSNKVIQDFTSFRKRQPNGTKDIEKLFVKDYGSNYLSEFKTDEDDEKTEYITKIFVFKILLNYRNMNKIQAGIGVRS